MAERFVSKFSLINQSEIPVLREGVPSFLGVPIARTAEELNGTDVAIIGVPYERPATAGREPGAWSGYGDGPAHARRASLRFAAYIPELDIDAFEHLKVVDFGDAKMGDDWKTSSDAVAAKVSKALSAGCKVVTIGGFSPCASYSVAQGFAEAGNSNVGCISLDAHADCNDTEYGPNGSREPGSATWEARMWDHFPIFDPAHHVEIGNRGPRNTRTQIQKYRQVGAQWYGAMQVKQRGIETVCAEAFPQVFGGVERSWLHLDMDVLDIGAVPDWGDEPLGLSVQEVIHVVHEAGKRGLDGLSFVYVAPNSPPIGAIVSYIVAYLLAGWVIARS